MNAPDSLLAGTLERLPFDNHFARLPAPFYFEKHRKRLREEL